MNKSKIHSQKSSKISVIGSGDWGLAISVLLAKNGFEVLIFSQHKSEADRISKKYQQIAIRIAGSNDFKLVVKDSNFIFIVVPSDAVLLVLKSLAQEKISTQTKIIICSKGMDSKNLQLFSDSIEQELPNNNYAILSGPNFASEVSKGLPTTTNIASKDKKTANQIVKLLKNDNFLPIISNDIISAQIFGAIKNIFAIGCGIIDGLGLGENAKAALVVKGTIESNLLITKLGGKPLTNFISPCGLGDLFLTCSSKKSRNNSLGQMIGSGKKIKDILEQGTTFEGFNASQIMIEFAKKHQTALPLCFTINQILQGNFDIKDIKTIISKVILSNKYDSNY